LLACTKPIRQGAKRNGEQLQPLRDLFQHHLGGAAGHNQFRLSRRLAKPSAIQEPQEIGKPEDGPDNLTRGVRSALCEALLWICAYNIPVRIPKRLEENPLLDVIAEIRFSSAIPADTVVGMVYSTLKDLFAAPASLPAVQIPALLRDADPNLKYLALYKFEGKGHYLQLGPRSVALGTPRPYRDWESVTPTLKEVLGKLEGIRLFDKIERTGLRYVNFFEGLNILQHTTLSLEVAGKSIADQNITVRAEHREQDRFTVILQLINTAVAEILGARKNGSVLDIDTICEPLNLSGEKVAEEIYRALTESNQIADNTFFGIVKQDLIEKYKPVY